MGASVMEPTLRMIPSSADTLLLSNAASVTRLTLQIIPCHCADIVSVKWGISAPENSENLVFLKWIKRVNLSAVITRRISGAYFIRFLYDFESVNICGLALAAQSTTQNLKFENEWKGMEYIRGHTSGHYCKGMSYFVTEIAKMTAHKKTDSESALWQSNHGSGMESTLQTIATALTTFLLCNGVFCTQSFAADMAVMMGYSVFEGMFSVILSLNKCIQTSELLCAQTDYGQHSQD